MSVGLDERDWDDLSPEEQEEKAEASRRRRAEHPEWLRKFERRIKDFRLGHGDSDWHEQIANRAFETWLARHLQELLQDFEAAEPATAHGDFDAGTLEDLLAQPAEPRFRVDGVLPWAGNMLVVAQRKVGKTTLALNLALSLLTGEPFLGVFPAIPIGGMVCLLNFEVAAGQVTRWADEIGIPQDRLLLVNLRGRRNPLSHKRDRKALAQLLRDHAVDAVIVDPFGAAFSGASQNDPGEVGRWLTDLDRFARLEAGATDLVLTAHAGWTATTRARGASALEDWADAIVTLSANEKTGERRFRAIGRDVDVPEGVLDFVADSRLLTLRIGADTLGAEGGANDLRSEVIRAVEEADPPGVSGNGLEAILKDRGVSFRKGEPGKLAQLAVAQGRLERKDGPRGANLYLPPPD